jgi:hypothetical protein
VRVNSTENDRRLSQDQDLDLMSSASLFRTETSGHRPGTDSAIPTASNADTKSMLHNHDVVKLVIEEMDLNTAILARAVCNSWRLSVKDAGLEPLEAGCTEPQMVLGHQSQKRLEQALALEEEVWTAAHIAKLAEYLKRQKEITAEMRHTLVNWLIEVHFKFQCCKQSSLYFSIKLVDLFLANNEVPHQIFQNVGVSAFLLACKCEEKFWPNTGDLSFITDYSSSVEQITEMERKILEQFKDNTKHPNPETYLCRFAEAAKLNFTNDNGIEYSTPYSMALYFIDAALLDATLVTTHPSLVAAAAIMCTLRVLGRSDWNKHLDYYTRYTRETVAELADRLIANGRASTPSAIEHKYTSQRLGGVGDQVGADGKTLNDGCLHVLADYYRRL